MSIALMLTNWTERFSTSTERFFFGVTMTLVGLTIVLLVLALISLMISTISRLIRGRLVARTDARTAAADSDSVAFTPAVNQQVSGNVGDAAWIAVLAAAIHAFNASAGKQTTAGFVIRRFRRV